MIYWRLLLLAIFVAIVCLLNLPRQISQIEYALAHNRTRMLERQILETSKAAVLASKSADKQQYVNALENLGWVCYQLSDVTRAEATFLKELEIAKTIKKPDYDAAYAHCLLNIATYYRERANYERASFYYNQIREYDLANLRGPDSRLARDLANLGLTYYLWGETINEADKRAELFCRAESFCETALTAYKLVPDSKRSQGDVIATQALVLRDLGLVDRAEIASKESRQILAEAGNKAVEP